MYHDQLYYSTDHFFLFTLTPFHSPLLCLYFASPFKNNTGILSADGESWKFQRKQATHLFNVNAFREYTSEVFNSEAQKVLNYLGKAADAGDAVDFHAIMHAFTLDVFGR
jgi:cytochrome P450